MRAQQSSGAHAHHCLYSGVRLLTRLLVVLLFGIVAAGCGTGELPNAGAAKDEASVDDQAARVNGAGATLPKPLYIEWIGEFQAANPDVRINYQGIGSGGGIEQFTKATVDFGASDAP